MLSSLSGFVIHLIQSAGYLGVFILMMLNSALVPIPSEVTMPFGGCQFFQESMAGAD